MILLLIVQFFIWLTYGIDTPRSLLPVTYEKYVTYDWTIPTCDKNSFLIITKNNMTYLNISIKHDFYGASITIPWCALTYGAHDTYEWYVSYYNCTKTVNETKFYVIKLKTYYATDELNSYTYEISKPDYSIIEIPHFKNSLDTSCLNIEIKIFTWSNNKFPTIKIHNDVDMCRYDYFSDNFYIPKFTHTEKYAFSSNLTLGCTYPDQIGPYDVVPGKKYIIEYNPVEYGKSIELKLQINSYVKPNMYYTLSIIFGSISIGVIGINVLIGMYFAYVKCCTNEHKFELMVNQDLNDVL